MIVQLYLILGAVYHVPLTACDRSEKLVDVVPGQELHWLAFFSFVIRFVLVAVSLH